MLGRERRVKGLDAECCSVALESLCSHEGERPQSPDVTVVNGASVVELELNGRVFALAIGQPTGVNEQRSGESRLHDEAVAGGEVEDDELGATPAALDCGARRATRQLVRRDFAQDVRFGYTNAGDSRPTPLA